MLEIGIDDLLFPKLLKGSSRIEHLYKSDMIQVADSSLEAINSLIPYFYIKTCKLSNKNKK